MLIEKEGIFMKEKTYTPAPLDTSDVQLMPNLIELTELLANNVHENWSKQKIAQGWQFGETLDEKLKTTPLLVPYEDLTDDYKLYDRQTALQTLKAILKLGFKISR